MDIPKAFQLTTDVWMVPCQIKANKRDFIPISRPFSSSHQSRDEKSRNAWKAEEDKVLQRLVESRGPNSWSSIAKELNSQVHKSFPFRKGKQCRERWINHLNPQLQKHQWTEDEDEIIRVLQRSLGNKWSEISRALHGRTENQVKNRWKSLKKTIEMNYLVQKPDLRICVTGLANDEDFERIESFDPIGKFCEGSPYSLEDLETPGSLTNEIKRLDYGDLDVNSKEDMPPLRMFSLTSEPDVTSANGLGMVHSRNYSKLDLDFLYADKSDTKDRSQVEGVYIGMFSDPFSLSWCFESEAFSINLNRDEEKESVVKRERKSSFNVDSDLESQSIY